MWGYRFSCFGERSDFLSALSGSPRRAFAVACAEDEAAAFVESCGDAPAPGPVFIRESCFCRSVVERGLEAVGFIPLL